MSAASFFLSDAAGRLCACAQTRCRLCIRLTGQQPPDPVAGSRAGGCSCGSPRRGRARPASARQTAPRANPYRRAAAPRADAPHRTRRGSAWHSRRPHRRAPPTRRRARCRACRHSRRCARAHDPAGAQTCRWGQSRRAARASPDSRSARRAGARRRRSCQDPPRSARARAPPRAAPAAAQVRDRAPNVRRARSVLPSAPPNSSKWRENGQCAPHHTALLHRERGLSTTGSRPPS